MNPYAVFVLATLLISFVVELVAEWLNLKALSPAIPAGYEGLYDAQQYAKSQEYTRVRTKFGLIHSAFSLAVLLIFWFAGGFNWLDHLVRNFGLGPVLTGLLYIGILVLASDLLSLPFSIYSTFVIEERFGFNRTTPRTFVTDWLKGLGLKAILGGAILALILSFFEAAGPAAWIYCWIASSLILIVLQFVAPIWIMPLFNKFTPLPDGELRKALNDYASKVHFTFKDLFVMDGSKRSTKANAFFTGFGKNKRIALFDTLVQEQTVPEVVGVLAHEVGHYKLHHIITGMIISLLQLGIMFFLFSLFLGNRLLFDAFGMEQISVYGALIFFGLLYEPVSFLLSIAMNAHSRHNEFAADRYSVQTAGDSHSLISALRKLSIKNLSNLTPHPFYVFLHYSHPPLMERVNAIARNAGKAEAVEYAEVHG